VTRALVLAGVLVASTALAGPAVPFDGDGVAAKFSHSTDAPSRKALDAALAAVSRAAMRGEVTRTDVVTIIDYTRPSTEPRLWVLDLVAGRVLYRELVAHGRNSGDNETRYFSNELGSLQSSRGLLVTDATYHGRNGYSLRLRGLDPHVNDRAEARAIVIHGAPYVSADTAARLGRLGRSWGCPAVRLGIARELIDRIKGGSAVFAYAPADGDSQ
jgi:L,D-transpeptidase catalytic domain